MFKELRRKDRGLSEDSVADILINGNYGILSTAGENGYAYGVPLNYVYFENSIYFHCAKEGFKLDCIEKNNKVSFCVVGRTQPEPEKFSYSYESVIAFGIAEEVEGEEKIQALLKLIEKYSGGYIEKGTEYIKNAENKTAVIKIGIQHVSGKSRKNALK